MTNPDLAAQDVIDALDKVREHDDVSFALVVGLLGAQAHRRADIVAALAGQ